MEKRLIVLDTETTGLEVEKGHRIIEIGGVVMNGRKKTTETFHVYVNPQRAIDKEAQEVHGISNEDVQDKPLFSEIAEDLLEFIDGSTLVIHNADFDVGFLDAEFQIASRNSLDKNIEYSAKSVTSSENRADLRSGGKYHRVRMHPTGAWTNAVGFDLTATPQGSR